MYPMIIVNIINAANVIFFILEAEFFGMDPFLVDAAPQKLSPDRADHPDRRADIKIFGRDIAGSLNDDICGEGRILLGIVWDYIQAAVQRIADLAQRLKIDCLFGIFDAVIKIDLVAGVGAQ